MIYAFLLAFLAAFLVSFPCGFLVRKYAPHFGLVDNPGHRKVHEVPVPTGGGLAIYLGVLLPFAFAQIGLLTLWLLRNTESVTQKLPEFLATHLGGLWQQSAKLWVLLALASVLVVLGTLDDRYNISWKIRIFVQFLVAGLAVSQGFRASFFLDMPIVTGILSVIWIVMLINSFNMLDNMNGLSSGVALICASVLAAVMLLNPDPTTNRPQLFIGGFLLVLLGAIFGFYMHNNPFRAKIFMGDGGAYFIGFVLGCMTLSATFADYNGSGTTIFVPLLVLAIPIYDTVSVIFVRLGEGRSPFVGDKSHFSHRLVERGLTNPQAVLTIYLATALCAIGSLLLYEVNFRGAMLIFTQCFFIIVLIAILEFGGGRESRILKQKKRNTKKRK